MKVEFLQIGEIRDKASEAINNFTDTQKITVHEIQYIRSNGILFAVIHYDQKIS